MSVTTKLPSRVKKEEQIERAKELYAKVPVKVILFNSMAKEFAMKPTSLKNGWFSMWSIPDTKIESVIIYLEKYVKNLS
jgi:hypothetical protein